MAKVTIGLDDSQLNAGLSRATANVKRFAGDSESAANKAGAAITKAFAFVGGVAAIQQIGGAIKGLMSEFDDISDAATKLGTTAESFQRIKLQADLAGASADGLTNALLKMQAGLSRSGPEAEKLEKALASLGISAAAFTAAAPEQKIAMLAEAFQKARAEGRGLSEIQDLFKKQFTELIPLLSSSSAELAKLAAQKVVSNEDVARLAAANDAIDAMVVSVKVLAGTSIANLMESFDFIDEKVRSLTNGLTGVKGIMDTVANFSSFGVPAMAKKAQELMSKDGPPTTSTSAAAAAATGITTTSTGNLPGLEAAVGFAASAPQIPGLRFAAPQSGALSRAADERAAAEKFASNGSAYNKEQLEALKRSNEILEKLASY